MSTSGPGAPRCCCRSLATATGATGWPRRRWLSIAAAIPLLVTSLLLLGADFGVAAGVVVLAAIAAPFAGARLTRGAKVEWVGMVGEELLALRIPSAAAAVALLVPVEVSPGPLPVPRTSTRPLIEALVCGALGLFCTGVMLSERRFDPASRIIPGGPLAYASHLAGRLA